MWIFSITVTDGSAKRYLPKMALSDKVAFLNPSYWHLFILNPRYTVDGFARGCSILGIDGSAGGCSVSGIGLCWAPSHTRCTSSNVDILNPGCTVDGSAMRLILQNFVSRQRGYSQSQVWIVLLKRSIPRPGLLCTVTPKTVPQDNVDILNPRCRWLCYAPSPQLFRFLTTWIILITVIDGFAKHFLPKMALSDKVDFLNTKVTMALLGAFTVVRLCLLAL